MNPNNLSRFDRMSIAMAIMEDLKPEMLEFLQQFGKDFLDHVAVGYHNTQVQKWREAREERQRREHREQRRFISDQAVTDPTIPSSGSTNHLLLKVNELVVAVDRVLKEQRDLHDQYEWLADRLDQQLAYIHKCDAWLNNDEGEAEPEAEEEEVEAPDD